MRRKLLLTVGLAILGACVVAGSAVGQGGVVGVGEGGVEIDLPNGQNLDDVQVLPQCSNLADDDGDGVKDLADPDCTGPLDATESGTSGVPAPTPPAPPEPPAGGGETGGDTGTGGEVVKPDGGFTGPGGSGGQGTGTGSGGRSRKAKPRTTAMMIGNAKTQKSASGSRTNSRILARVSA